ncbi:MAG: 2-C-methyl-D-erythritol 4-phosphate cytidylyltransferase [Candidatus Margulisiibacteriota bacterium]
MTITAIILASGRGDRFLSVIPKQFLSLEGKPILAYSLEAYENNPHISEIILVMNPEYMNIYEKWIPKKNYPKLSTVIPGGLTRQQSSFEGIKVCSPEATHVLIHDAARPLISQRIINDCVKKLQKVAAVSTVIPANDTIYEIDSKHHLKHIPDRRYLCQVQTPQGFKFECIREAHELSLRDNRFDITDDASLVFAYQLSTIGLVQGDPENIKITYPQDLELAKMLLKSVNQK